MARDDAALLTEYPLSDECRARVRLIRPDDAPRLIALFDRLSEETVRYRFFIAKKELLPQEAEHFARVDYRERTAIVAECVFDGEPQLVGVARYDASRSDLPDCAEFAVVVEDRFQGHGLGKILLNELVKAARANGLRALAGDTLADNQNMLRFLNGSGYPVRYQRDGTELRFVLDISQGD